jgi:hypothetical protein
LGLEETAAYSQGTVLAWLGVLHLIKQDSGHQHGVDALPHAVAQNQGAQLLDPREGVVAQGLQLIEALREELSDGGLGAVNPKPTVELPQFLGREVDWVRALTFQRRGVARRVAGILLNPGGSHSALVICEMASPGQNETRGGETKSKDRKKDAARWQAKRRTREGPQRKAVAHGEHGKD